MAASSAFRATSPTSGGKHETRREIRSAHYAVPPLPHADRTCPRHQDPLLHGFPGSRLLHVPHVWAVAPGHPRRTSGSLPGVPRRLGAQVSAPKSFLKYGLYNRSGR